MPQGARISCPVFLPLIASPPFALLVGQFHVPDLDFCPLYGSVNGSRYDYLPLHNLLYFLFLTDTLIHFSRPPVSAPGFSRKAVHNP